MLERIPADSHPMDVLRRGFNVRKSGNFEKSFDQQQDVADRILLTLPTIIYCWYRFSHDSAT